MSNISSLNNSSLYYQLSNQSSGANLPNSAASPSSLTNSLLQDLSSSSSSSSTSSNAYLLDLSPAAQQYLNGSSSSTAANALSGTNTNFTLTAQQQQAITAILTKYKNAPYTQATFDQIQNDLNSAGLGANQLSLQDQVNSFNPTQILVDDLDGNTSSSNSALFSNTSDSNEQTKSNNYMQQIIAQWQQISGNTQASSAAPATVAAAGGA